MTPNDEMIAWIFRLCFTLLIAIIVWFLKRTAASLDKCNEIWQEVKQTDLPNLDKRVALLEQRTTETEKDIGELVIRDITKGAK